MSLVSLSMRRKPLSSATDSAFLWEALRHGRFFCHLFVVLAVAIASQARADSEGFIDNWPGDVKIELRTFGASGPTTFPIPATNVIQPLGKFITERWSDHENLTNACDKIRDRFHAVTNFSRWLSCEITTAGELRGMISSTNTLDLKYVVTGNRVRFKNPVPNPFPAGVDPTIQADFDIVLRLKIVFDGTIDGRRIPKNFESRPIPPSPPDPPNAVYLVQPASMTTALVTFAAAKFSLTEAFLGEGILIDLFGGEAKLRNAERMMNTAADDLSPKMRDLGEMNRAAHRGANQLAELIHSLHPDLGFPTPLFNLAAFINPEQSLVVQYQREGDPPQPLPGCRCTGQCGDEVTCGCAGAGIIVEGERIFLQRLRLDGSWVSVGDTVGTDFVTGSALGARTGETLTHRVCRLNQFGSNCTAPFSFVYQDIGPCAPPGAGLPGSGPPHFCHPCLQ